MLSGLIIVNQYALVRSVINIPGPALRTTQSQTYSVNLMVQGGTKECMSGGRAQATQGVCVYAVMAYIWNISGGIIWWHTSDGKLLCQSIAELMPPNINIKHVRPVYNVIGNE